MRLRRRFLLLGIGLAVSYWLIETVADSAFGGEGPVATRLFPADPNEIWMRLIIVCLILAFTGYASRTLEWRTRTERRLRMLESAVEHTDDAVVITTAGLDPPGPEIVYVNEAFCRQTGYTMQELLGGTPRMLQGPNSDRAVLDQLRKCLELKEHFIGCLTNYRKDGSPFRVELRISPVYGPGGEVTHWICAQQDVTERERSEAALKESEARKTAIMESALDCIITMDHAGMITDFNPAAEHTFGYRRAEVLGRELAEAIVPPALREPHRRGLARYFATGEGAVINRRIELQGMRADGTEFPVEMTVAPIRLGDQAAFTGYLRDITERKRAEEALRQAEKKYRSIFENAIEGIFQTSLDGRIVTANPAAARIFGYDSPEEAVASISDVGRQVCVDPDDRARFDSLIRHHGVVADFETRLRRKDGSVIWASLNAHAIRGRDGELLGFEGTIEDISERKRAESALREVREAERRQVARDLHDEVLQQLIDALYSMQVTRLKLRDEGIDVPEIDKEIDDIRKAIEGLRDAINNLRRGGIQEQPFSHLLESVVAATRQKAPHIEIDLDVEVSLSSEPSGTVGIELLRIIQEALVNVRRHSGAHHVRVILRGGEGLLTVEVADDGRGFDPETAWGGVGLSAMQERASKLGGEVGIQSEPGQGTRVTVMVPAESALAVCAVGRSENSRNDQR